MFSELFHFGEVELRFLGTDTSVERFLEVTILTSGSLTARYLLSYTGGT